MVGAAGHGGQTLITDAARIGGVTDLVVHRLRDVDEPVHLFPVGEATFPALRVVKSSPSTNLPIRPTRLIKSCTKQHVLCREGPWRQSLRRARSTEATRAQPDPTQDSHPVVVLRQQDGQSWSCASRTESLRLLGLLGLLGRTDFLDVADSKLCSRKAMTPIDSRGGRFVTVMPRSRAKDGAFRKHLQTHAPVWTEAFRRPGKRLGDPDEIYSTTPAPLPSAEGYRIVWVHSTAKASRDAQARASRIDAGVAAIEALEAKLTGPRSRFKTRVAVEQAAGEALAEASADRWVTVTVSQTTTKNYKQARAGRPGPNTNYREVSSTRFTVSHDIRLDVIRYDAASDGCFPLITNDRVLSDADVLGAYRYQPNLERRHHLLTSVQMPRPCSCIAPPGSRRCSAASSWPCSSAPSSNARSGPACSRPISTSGLSISLPLPGRVIVCHLAVCTTPGRMWS